MGIATTPFRLSVLALAWVLSAASAAVGQAVTGSETPFLLQADGLQHDRDTDVITASGNVEISQGGRVLLGDAVTYDRRQDILTASGNVSFLQESGEVIFGQHMELTGDMKDGVVRDLRMLLSDNSRFAAAGARRSAGERLDMRQVVYSPCNLCPNDPTEPPLWQVKAVKVVHDSKTKTIEYTDAWLEVHGIPVAYTPYLSHPDPTVRRRSGIIRPTFGGSSDLGFVARASYFFDLAQHKDLTLTPIITAKEGPILAGEYRHLFTNARLNFDGSITHDSEDELRGHIRGDGVLDIDNTWRAGFEVDRATDDTFLRRYGFGGGDTLTSRLYAEGFRKRNYVAVQGYAFQGLEVSDDPGQTPLVFPLFDYNHVGEVGVLGGHTNLDINALGLTRSEGTDSRRLSVGMGWTRPFVGPIGDLYTLSTNLRGDAYHVEGVTLSNTAEKFTGWTGRVHPMAALEWRWPLARSDGSIQQLLEPVASAVVSPYGGNPDKIPNEDSQDFEFDDSNLFETNRFTGLDRVEGGPRVNYGLRWGLFGQGGGRSAVFVGQSYRVKADSTFGADTGLEDNFSDIVARVIVSPGPHLDLMYRTRFDKDNLEIRRNEVRLDGGPATLRLNFNYTFIDRRFESEFAGQEEVQYTVASRLSRFWRAKVSGIHDLATDEGLRSLSIGATYEDECLVFSTTLSRTFFEDRDLRPTYAVLFQVSFKTLGEVQTSVR